MAAIIATAQNYWISTSALTITLNALGEANRVQASVASGAQIMCYIRGVDGLDFDEGHNYRRWPLTVSPTFFNTNTHKYLYVVIPRTTAIGTQAMVWFPSQLLDVNGCAIDEEGEPAEQVGNPDYYYIWLQGIISSSGASGNTPRTWEQQPQTGTLATDEAVSPTGGFWYQWDAISQTVTFLKDIWMDAASTFRNLILGGKTLTGVAVDDTTPDDSTTHVATPAYIKSISNDRYLRKDRDDITPYSLTVEQELRVGNRGIMNDLQSTDYTGDGMLDSGYKLWYEEGRAKLVIDDLVARGKFTVNELETRIWTYAGGNMIFSGAGSTIFFVEYLDANENPLGYTYINQPWLLRGRALLAASLSWSKRRQIQRQLNETERAQVVKFRCYEFSDDGTMQTRNWWHTNDIAMCQTLNKVRDKVNADGSYSGYASNTVYKRRVAGIGSKKIPMLNDDRVYDYVDLWNIYDVYGQTYINSQGQTVTITDSVKGFLNMAPSGSDPSTDWPSAGDVIVQMGNPLDTDRQAAVTIEVQGDVHGFKVYDTISDYSMANKEWVEIGYDQTTGKAKANVYGDFRFGCRESEEAQGGSYVKYDRTTKVLDIKAKINARSTMPYNGSDTTLANIFSGLNQQIDGKIETWQQDSDPANDWTTDDLKAKHVGDLWMDTSSDGGKKTYIYKDKGASAYPRYDWEPQDVPQAVFDGIDGKAAVYSEWGAWGDKLHLRDLLIPSADIQGTSYKAGKVYRCTQVTPSIVFIEVNYTDDTNFNGYIHALLNGSGASGDAATAAAAQYAVIRAVKGDTVVDGGLLLTSLIALRQFNGQPGQEDDPQYYTTWGGISGIYNNNINGNGIAAWFGGPMVDSGSSKAKIVFRHNGSGYLADGKIYWDTQGNCHFEGEITATSGSIGGFTIGADYIGQNTEYADHQGYTFIERNGCIDLWNNNTNRYALRVNGKMEVHGTPNQAVYIDNLATGGEVFLNAYRLNLNTYNGNNSKVTIGNYQSSLEVKASQNTFDNATSFGSNVDVAGVASFGGNIVTGGTTGTFTLPGTTANPPKEGTSFMCKGISRDLTVTAPSGFKIQASDSRNEYQSLNLGASSYIITYMGSNKWGLFNCN